MPSTITKSLTLLSCTFLGLICGTLYLYSSYSPQLAQRLSYSATDSSLIALFGSLGVAVTGPVAGLVVDRKGYTVSLAIGGLSICLGYYGLRRQFASAMSNLSYSCFLLFIVGLGSTFINSACLKCCAVSFPNIRGVATSLPLALYGLSAMFYSVIASVYYPGDTSGFLWFLIVSVGVILAICSPQLMLCDIRNIQPKRHAASNSEIIQMTTIGQKLEPEPIQYHGLHHNTEASGFDLLRSPRFWLLFIATGAFASLGQMYIYTVGYMVKALVTNTFTTPVDTSVEYVPMEVVIQQEQQVQVGLLSVANCVGRLSAGILGDIISQSFRKPRGWLLFIPGLGLVITQIMGLSITQPHHLEWASMLSGFFYGFTFCIMPIIVGDVFGMENFSGNWGLVGMSPIVPSFFFTNHFGKVYDRHSSMSELGITVCTLGNGCYRQVYKLTLGVSVFAILIISIFNFGERYLASRSLYDKRKGVLGLKSEKQ
ncbi:hypothetical protein FT663_00622 [Candidozyma haemuli var. vulneris]|uniref:Nodulin-like domain-containing protein n=1 Tax=Candidozyma haemuli TaxID=45357 RepID=A0A2V1ANW2_9ASCO|nr:hypothetical protein CXQ85_003405 [[Candida] haemuloni]KAF3989000.1 hypothetical protein FT662_03061 [[Candida] haemuloni var. vulneris]KAF3995244.1 hypothetical protein FT663_00622 [[Candida] haemuloni var. vulneris]PVH19559.1 hypothetical protein CXQ85_003405 [[Candida] haemuloni]